jgi:hypothetical protein
MADQNTNPTYSAANKACVQAMVGSYLRDHVDEVLETVAEEADENGERQAIRAALLQEADELDPEGAVSVP